MDEKRTYRVRGEAIRAARVAMGQTQRWLAGAARVSDRTVLRAEKGEDVVLDNLISICAALAIDWKTLPEADERDASPEQAPAPRTGAIPSAWRWVRSSWSIGGHAIVATMLVLLGVGPYYLSVAVGHDRQSRSIVDVTRTAQILVQPSELSKVVRAYAGGQTDVDVLRKMSEDIHLDYDRCDLAGWVGFLAMTGCPLADAETRIVSTSMDGLVVGIGPLSKEMLSGILPQLSLEKEVDVHVASAPTLDAPLDDLPWTAPLGPRRSAIDDFVSGDWLLLDIRRTGGRP